MSTNVGIGAVGRIDARSERHARSLRPGLETLRGTLGRSRSSLPRPARPAGPTPDAASAADAQAHSAADGDPESEYPDLAPAAASNPERTGEPFGCPSRRAALARAVCILGAGSRILIE